MESPKFLGAEHAGRKLDFGNGREGTSQRQRRSTTQSRNKSRQVAPITNKGIKCLNQATGWIFEDDERGTKARNFVLARIPLGRLAELDDFACVLVFLASATSSMMTRQILDVDGSFSAN